MMAISDAMEEASNLKENDLQDPEADDVLRMDESLTDYQILHKAAGIIRKTMEDVHHDHQYYASSDDLSFSYCRDYVPSFV